MLLTEFHSNIMDFTRTSFHDESFDVVWACESVCQATDKAAFMRECHRILKKGGRLILGDFFLTDDNREDRHSWIRKWCDTWAVSGLISCDAFTEKLRENGLNPVRIDDYTDKIIKSARRMYYASIIGALPSEIYNLFHPKVSRFARTHYKCGYYQYKALMEGLWRYWILLAVKPNYERPGANLQLVPESHGTDYASPNPRQQIFISPFLP